MVRGWGRPALDASEPRYGAWLSWIFHGAAARVSLVPCPCPSVAVIFPRPTELPVNRDGEGQWALLSEPVHGNGELRGDNRFRRERNQSGCASVDGRYWPGWWR